MTFSPSNEKKRSTVLKQKHIKHVPVAPLVEVDWHRVRHFQAGPRFGQQLADARRLTVSIQGPR